MLEGAQRSCYVHQQMNTSKPSSNAQACAAQVASEASPQPPYQQIKLALDVHAASIVVVRMMDGAKPQPPQTFKPADFLAWAKQQVALAQEVIRSDYLQNGARETGLGQWLPGFLRSHHSANFKSHRLTMPQKNVEEINETS
jgi:hypothetical protein